MISPKLILHTFVIFDDKEVAFALKNETNEICGGILVADTALAQGMAQYFDHLFKLGRPYNQAETAKQVIKSLLK
jgi:hypothetical protein